MQPEKQSLFDGSRFRLYLWIDNEDAAIAFARREGFYSVWYDITTRPGHMMKQLIFFGGGTGVGVRSRRKNPLWAIIIFIYNNCNQGCLRVMARTTTPNNRSKCWIPPTDVFRGVLVRSRSVNRIHQATTNVDYGCASNWSNCCT